MARRTTTPTALTKLTALDRSFFARDTVVVARDLLGTLLVHRSDGRERIGMIVETEAYLGPHDKAAHARFGPASRPVLFGPIGHAYVYLIYGMYECVNVVTEREGKGSAVLIRAVEPITGITERTAGPGLLTRAMGISRAHNGRDFLSEPLFLAARQTETAPKIDVSHRIGVDYAGQWAKRRLRFSIRGNPHVSKRR